ncbi:MAG: PEP-CTERM sorting domain-containing protein [Planctomycetaceae bacterium]|nr:PEP-CTERM sorting domain-containing protein [Planctomycetaceae bacterium]
MRTILATILMIGCVVAFAGGAWADEWNTSQSGDWSDPATWGGATPVGGPPAGDYARLWHSGIVFDAAATDGIWGFVFGDNASLTLQKDIHVATHARIGGYGSNSTLNSNGHDIYSGDFMSLGVYVYGGATPNTTLTGGGKVFVTNGLTVGGGNALAEISGGTVGSVKMGDWGDGNTLRITQNSGQQDGLTVSSGSITFSGSNIIDLQFAAPSADGLYWALRLAGSHTGELETLHTAGTLTWTAPYVISVFEQDGYTYVGNPNVVGTPEPATMSLLAIGGIAALIRRKRR